MIEKAGLYWATCDACKRSFDTVAQREIILFELKLSGWRVRGDGCTCPDCVKEAKQ